MSSPNFLEFSPYLEILFILIVLVVSSALYFIFRSIIMKLLISQGKIAGSFLSRLVLPTVFILVVLLLKLIPPRGALPLSQRFYQYVDAVFIFLMALLFIRLVDALFLTWHLRRQLPLPLPKVLHNFILLVLYLAVLFAILRGILGINITPFLATSALLTMILGLAFQGVLSNVLSGMSLHLIRSFSKGDWIQVGSNEGEVLDTNWRETRIVDLFSNIVVLPNNVVATETLINYSHPDKKMALIIPVKVSYEAPPSLVLEALREAALDVPEVTRNPRPEAYITEFDDFGISYVLKFWITDFRQKYIITGKVGRLIWYKFKRRNIEIPVPLSGKLADMLKAVEKEKTLEISKEEEEQKFRELVNSSFLRHQEGAKAGELLVPEEEIQKLASAVSRQRFAPGEILFKQGDQGESCYVVASGKVKGTIILEEKGKRYTSEFKVESGGIFGEMSLFTGMCRTATCVVEEESELLKIEAEDFALLLAENPKLAEVMAEIVSARNRKNKAFLKKIKELSKKDMEESCSKSSVLQRLKRLILRLKK
jgi:small-conductance mechanosensitive channel/CRP-like cAMP-binding protein